VQQLESLGWIVSVEPETLAGRVGRPAVRYRFDQAAGYVLGLDIGAHTVKAAVGDLGGDLVAIEERVVSEFDSASVRLAAVREAALASMSAAGINRNALLAATAGTVGIVDEVGTVTLSTVIPGWTGFDLAASLDDFLGCRVRVETDARLAALAERWRGSAAAADRLVYVHTGHRVGSALLIGGQIYRGATGAAGEIGALRQLGWSNALASLNHLTERSGQSPEVALASREPAAKRALAGLVKSIAPGISALVLVLDPDMVVLGGGLAGLGKTLSEPIIKGLESLCLRVPEVQTSTLGAHGVLVGAVRECLDWVDRNVFAIEPA
jgi:predicted NBD/HSP70 family sugar kinase